MSQQRYSPEFKDEAVLQVTERGRLGTPRPLFLGCPSMGVMSNPQGRAAWESYWRLESEPTTSRHQEMH
jgi:transposase-like protein